MDYLSAMRAFVRAVDLGSFSKAAAESGAKISTVSRYIAALEADLGSTLLHRSTRRLNVTEAGETFYRDAVRIVQQVEAARHAVSSLNEQPRGLLRIQMPTAFGRRHVLPHLPRFFAQYPAVNVDATLTHVTADLIEAGADLAIRICPQPEHAVVAHRLAPHRWVLCASTRYLRSNPPIRVPADLSKAECLEFALFPSKTWHFTERATGAAQSVGVSGRLRVNNSEALRDAALAGVGIGLLPTWLVGEDLQEGYLVPLLPEWQATLLPGPDRWIWGVYPSKEIVLPKVSAFLAFLDEQFGRPPYWDRPARV